MTCFDHDLEVKPGSGWSRSQASTSLELDREHALVSRNAFISLPKIIDVDLLFEMPALRQRNDSNGGADRQFFTRMSS
jgi:hypothetical protein